jgi:hypothetical protein
MIDRVSANIECVLAVRQHPAAEVEVENVFVLRVIVENFKLREALCTRSIWPWNSLVCNRTFMHQHVRQSCLNKKRDGNSYLAKSARSIS